MLYEGTSCSALQETFPNIAVPKTVAQGRFEGVEPMLWRRLQEKGGDAKGMEGYFLHTPCRACGGERLNPLSRGAAVRDVRLPQLSALSLDELRRWLEKLRQELPSAHQKLVEPYLLDLQTKLRRLSDVGLGYLSLERQAGTLSGGETQRLRLAAALDSDITGIIYMLDEPTVGLHPQDTQGMIDVLKQLRDNGNTVLVIEHDPDVMRAADHIIDIGPGAGRHGGQVVGSGTLEELAAQPDSVTGAWLARHRPQKRTPRAGDGRRVKIRNACLHNLQNVDAEFPVRCLSAVTGVSGSGKSSLVFGVLADEREQRTHVAGLEHFSRVVVIEQEALVRMRRSNVATYTGLYSDIRSLFAATPKAKKLGLGAGAFSFNKRGADVRRAKDWALFQTICCFSRIRKSHARCAAAGASAKRFCLSGGTGKIFPIYCRFPWKRRWRCLTQNAGWRRGCTRCAVRGWAIWSWGKRSRHCPAEKASV